MVSPVAVRNYWPDAKCAKAFWSQQEVRPYRRLLADTLDWAAPASGEKWLDLGCGSGPLSAGLWERSGGQVAEVIGLDCAAVNEQAYAKLRATLAPAPGDRVRFLCHDFSRGTGRALERLVRSLHFRPLDHVCRIVVGRARVLDDRGV